jgi:hypothetical protein
MTDEDPILDDSELFTEEEILAEFQASCEAEAETPEQHAERIKRATKIDRL